MKRSIEILVILCLASSVLAGFKVKNIKPRKPENFQCRVTVANVTYAADLLLSGKDQEDYFYKALAPFGLIAVRLAVFNKGKSEVALPLNDLELLTPDGGELHPANPESVAQSILQGTPLAASSKTGTPQVRAGVGGAADPRLDPTDPRYDPRLDPNNPRYDPSDPQNSGQYPTGTYPSSGRWGRPGIVLSPGGGGEDLSQFERQLAEKDYCDKAHTSEPILASMSRDRFLYFPMGTPPKSSKGFMLRLPAGPGIPQEVVLKF